jgi:hypothetical protein
LGRFKTNLEVLDGIAIHSGRHLVTVNQSERNRERNVRVAGELVELSHPLGHMICTGENKRLGGRC